jgi:cytochrome c-type biogenesis protein CcmH/NrfG
MVHIRYEAPAVLLALVVLLTGCGLSKDRIAIYRAKQTIEKRNRDPEELSKVRGRLKQIITTKLQAARYLDAANRVLGRKYMEMGSYNLAEEALREAEYLNPNNAYIKMDLGECCYLLSQSALDEDRKNEYLVRSRNYYRKAIELKGDLTEARYGYGLLLFFGFKDTQGAIREMKKVLVDEPGHVDAHFALGRFYYESGESGKALGEYLLLMELLPKNSPRRKKAEENIGQINREQAVR